MDARDLSVHIYVGLGTAHAAKLVATSIKAIISHGMFQVYMHFRVHADHSLFPCDRFRLRLASLLIRLISLSLSADKVLSRSQTSAYFGM